MSYHAKRQQVTQSRPCGDFASLADNNHAVD